jgi:hypothetical protein
MAVRPASLPGGAVRMGDTPDRRTPTLADGSWEHPSGGGTTATADPVPVRDRSTDMAGGAGTNCLDDDHERDDLAIARRLGDRSIVRALR